jgi:outer membrane protein assembly factor BamD (BamD/ComL family)
MSRAISRALTAFRSLSTGYPLSPYASEAAEWEDLILIELQF